MSTSFRRFAAFVLADRHRFGELRVVHVAGHDAINFRVQEKTFQVHQPLAAAADDAEPDLVVGPRFAGARQPDESRPQGTGGQAGGRGFADEISTCQFLHF
jgi:hypothetical protein